MKLTVVGNTYKIKHDLLERVADATFSFLDDIAGDIELKFVSSKKMAELNQSYRRINKPTDVLSFKLSDSPLVGQVFICYTYTKKQAASICNELNDEVCLLLVHGIFHIYGYDHNNEKETEIMQSMEIKILKKERV